MLCRTLLGNMQLSICYDVLKKRPHEEDQKKEAKSWHRKKKIHNDRATENSAVVGVLQLTERCETTNFIKIEKLQ